LIIRGNGLGYYAWLRSILIDGDLSFGNEFDDHRLPGEYVPPPSYTTPVGRRANQWSVGPACLWSPAVVLVHIGLCLADPAASWCVRDGYSLPYQFAVGISGLLFALVGISRLWKTCRYYARPSRAALAVVLTVLGTTIAYYSAVEPSMAHGLGTAMLATFVWYWLATYGSPQIRRWLVVGGLLGAAALVRWQLATFAVLPAGEALLLGVRGHARRGGARMGRVLLRLAATLLGAVIGFSPQMICWHSVYGEWLVAPVPGVRHHWLSPSLWDVFLSQDRSLFYWTPATFIILLASSCSCFSPNGRYPEGGPEVASHRVDCVRLLCLGFAIQVYVLASMWGQGEFVPHTDNYAGVYLANSYGFRDLTESFIVLAPGLASMLERSGRVCYGFLAGVGLVLVGWNLVLVCEYYHGLLPVSGGAGVRTLLVNAWRLIREEPSVLFLVLEGPLLVAFLLLGGGLNEGGGQALHGAPEAACAAAVTGP
jgi:hypothetical protein